MSQRIVIATFTYPHQAQLMKTMLEAEGIPCFLQDELTAQVNNFYSTAIGGVKLEVMQEDVPEAMALLQEAGYENKPAWNASGILNKLDLFAQKLPLIRKYEREQRLMLLVIFGVVILAVAIYLVVYLADLGESNI